MKCLVKYVKYTLLLSFIGLNFLSAQNLKILPFAKTKNETPIDSASVRVLYALNANDIKNLETYDDLQRLEIGSKLSKYYSFFTYNRDSLTKAWLIEKPQIQNAYPATPDRHSKTNNWSDNWFSDIFKDFSTNVMTTYITMPQWMWNDNCYYEENIDLQQWEILEDTLTVCENLCQKATCTFRGRKYVAWFTMNIPISNGPWKFGGLPGLILKIYDTDNIYVFECVGIEYHKEKYIIRKWDYSEFKFTKGKRENTLKLIKKIHENFYQVSGLRNNDGTPLVWNPIPYHPLELE